MDEMISYIFGTLHYTENAVKNMKKTLESQSRINRRVATFALVCAAYVTVLEIHNKEQNKKIEKLSKDVEELKRTKGV